jgi:hypothetical protein
MMIEASQRTIGEQNNPIINKHFELEINTLQNAPRRDADKLERLLRIKERQKEEAMYMEDTQKGYLQKRETEMLKVVLYLVCRNNDMRAKTSSNNQH